MNSAHTGGCKTILASRQEVDRMITTVSHGMFPGFLTKATKTKKNAKLDILSDDIEQTIMDHIQHSL